MRLLHKLLLFVFILALWFHGIGSPAALRAQTPSVGGAIGLPQGCGGVTPGGDPSVSCCISGYVWMDG